MFNKKKNPKDNISLVGLHHGKYSWEEIDACFEKKPFFTEKQKIGIAVATGIFGVGCFAYSMIAKQNLYHEGILSFLATIVIVAEHFDTDNKSTDADDTSILDGSGFSPFNPKK